MNDPRIEQRDAQPYAAIAFSGTMPEMMSALPRLWPEVAGWLAARNETPAGAPFIRYVTLDMEGAMGLEIGIPTAHTLAGDERVVSGAFPAGRWAVDVHVGHYDGLMQANADLQAWASEQGESFARDGEAWPGRYEGYLTDPQSEPDPAKWQTELAYLLAD